VPKGEWLSGEALSTLKPGKRPVFYCKSGMRSAEVLAIAKQAGFSDALHEQGGVVAWVKQVDPSLPIY